MLHLPLVQSPWVRCKDKGGAAARTWWGKQWLDAGSEVEPTEWLIGCTTSASQMTPQARSCYKRRSLLRPPLPFHPSSTSPSTPAPWISLVRLHLPPALQRPPATSALASTPPTLSRPPHPPSPPPHFPHLCTCALDMARLNSSSACAAEAISDARSRAHRSVASESAAAAEASSRLEVCL
jgi:hypothetical protein